MTARELIKEMEDHPEFMDLPVVFADYFHHSIDDIAWKEIPVVNFEYAKESPTRDYKPECIELYFGE